MSFRDRLKRLHDAHHRGKKGEDGPEGVYRADDAQESDVDAASKPPAATPPNGWAGLGATRDNRFGAPVWIAGEVCDHEQPHGHWTIQGCRRADHSFLVDYIDGLDEAPDASDLLYLDTETTGLGENAFAFMIGVAFWEDQALQVEHLLIDDPDHEAAMLQTLAQRYADRPVLVTFNGRRFDLPLLQRRYAHHALDDPIEGRPHLDLLPFARDAFNGLSNYKLATLEQEILEFHRVDDVPGSQIPKRWWTFKKNKNSDLMRGVLEHNRHDVVSMAALVAEATLGAPERPQDDGRPSDPWSRFWPKSSSNQRAASSSEARDPRNDGVAARLERSYRLRDKFAQPTGAASADSSPSRPQGQRPETSVEAYCTTLRDQAHTLLDAGLHHQALPLLAEALALDPAHTATRQALADIYRHLGKAPLADALLGTS